MAKPMTKAKLVTALAEATSIPKKTSAAYLEELARLAHKARKGRNPQTGAEIRIPARKRLKFVIAKAAKDAVFGA